MKRPKRKVHRRATPDQKTLLELLRYDPSSGKLFWRKRNLKWFEDSPTRKAAFICILWNARYADTEAFTDIRGGYHRGNILGNLYKAHRIIWKMIHGIEPDQIDHIDQDRTNNRPENLRSVASAENARNHPMQKNNTSGATGVHLRHDGKYRAFIGGSGSRKNLGTFDSFDAAVRARKIAELEHNFHPNHGVRKCSG